MAARTTRVYLSRKNLCDLLSKLNRRAEGEVTACTLIKRDNKHPRYPQTMKEIEVVAVEDYDYYSHREPGRTAEDMEYLKWLKDLAD